MKFDVYDTSKLERSILLTSRNFRYDFQHYNSCGIWPGFRNMVDSPHENEKSKGFHIFDEMVDRPCGPFTPFRTAGSLFWQTA